MTRVHALVLVLLAAACGARDGAPAGASDGSGSSSSSAATTSSSGDPSATTTTTAAGSGTGDTSTGSATAESSSTGGTRSCDGVFPEHWSDGTDCGSEPEVMVHRYDERTWILRQSLCTSFEGPFLYLLFGEDRVLLEDTGAGSIAIADVVYGIIDEWLVEQGRASIELVVVSSHAHSDHVAGNGQFVGRADTTVVEPSVAGLVDFFGIGKWPTEIVQFDLGNRVVDVIPIPGHEPNHIALFDRESGLLLTGDTLYPGRLYIDDFPTYVASIARMVDEVPADEVCHVLGTHIEMTTQPGVDFELGADQHPGEHVLRLDWAHLLELRAAVEAMDTPQIEIHDDFIVYPL